MTDTEISLPEVRLLSRADTLYKSDAHPSQKRFLDVGELSPRDRERVRSLIEMYLRMPSYSADPAKPGALSV